MITKKTVLILGAGASLEYGFPSGKDLLQQIRASCVNPGTNTRFMNALRDVGITRGQDHARQFGEIIDRSPFLSIDALLEHHTDFIPLGKAAIASHLLPCEQSLRIHDVHRRSESWYHYLWNQIQTPKAEDWACDELAILTYNYDRSLDFFLRDSIRSVYKKSDFEVEEMMNRLPIIHLHGQLGPLAKIPFGKHVPDDPRDFKIIADGIKIIHEPEQNREMFDIARRYLHASSKIVFLGFGFHRTNIERLFDDISFSKEKWGTAYGQKKREIEHIQKLVKGHGPFLPLNVLEFLRETCCLVP